MITLILVEDHEMVRKGLRSLLVVEPIFELVGEASDGMEAVVLARKLRPDIMVLDLGLPRLHGLEVIRQVRRETATRVVVVSMHSDKPYVTEALRAGASGYVLKESSPDELVRAIRTVHGGGHHYAARLKNSALASMLPRWKAPADPFETLTARERLVLQFAAEGYSNADVAAKLYVSSRTVETHRANFLKKLSLRSQTELVRFAIRRGIIAP